MTYFDHEKLNVYQRSLEFLIAMDSVLESTPKTHAVHNQLDRASTSIPLNTAEGNGKYTSKDRCRFFDIARGSALECAACLDVLRIKGLLELDKENELKSLLKEVVSMLVGLIKAQPGGRVAESSAEYNTAYDE